MSNNKRLRHVIGVPQPAASLASLTLSASTVAEGSIAGTVIGSIVGRATGSVLSLIDDSGGRFILSGTSILAGLVATDYETTTSHSITIREALTGASNTPHDTTLSITVTNVPEVVLNTLSGTFTLLESAGIDDIAGSILGTTAGSTLTLVDNAGNRVALAGNNVIRGAASLDYEAGATFSFTVRETHPEGTNSPNDTILVCNITNVFEKPSLAPLSLSATSYITGTPASGTINGATTGSTITASGLPSGLTINGAARTWGWDGTGSVASSSFTLTETLSDSPNSPNPSTISYAITNPGSGFATPTLTNYSTLGATPVVLEWSSTDYTVGLYGQLQIDQTSNAFSNITQNIVFFIDGDSWARLDQNVGLSSPSGTYYARIRACRENEAGSTTVSGTDPAGAAITFNADVSLWSTTFTDNLGYTATFNPSNKNSGVVLTNSNRTMTGTDHGSTYGETAALTTILHNPTGYIEFTYNGGTVTSSVANAGIIDTGASLGSSSVHTYVYGTAFRVGGGIYKQNVLQTTKAALSVGDTIAVVAHLASKKVWFKDKTGAFANGTPVFDADGSLNAATTGGYDMSALANLLPSATAERADSWIVNPGSSSFVFTPPTNCVGGWS